MTSVDYKELKKGGFMRQVQKDHFSMRLRVVGGQLKSKQLKKVYEIAEKFGQGYVHMTSRQGIEVPFIKYEDIKEVKEELLKAGLEPGACGPRVRTITACQGNIICRSGLIDTTTLAQEFDKKYFAKEVPHKFKIGLTGCGNNCLKAEENDLGIKGGTKPSWSKDKCNYCGLCEVVCPTKAINVKQHEKEFNFDIDKCIYCGKCVKSCPTDAWKGENGFIISFGGLFGNRIAIGKQIIPIVFNKEEVHRIVDITLEFFKKYGKSGERFRNTLDRVGWDSFENVLRRR